MGEEEIFNIKRMPVHTVNNNNIGERARERRSERKGKSGRERESSEE
jgi:hypothetical protein